VSPSPSKPNAVELAFQRGDLELEVVPQGTLIERIRTAGAGIPAFYTRTSAGTPLGDGKETRVFNGEETVLEFALPGDVALIRAHKADTLGNVTYRGTSRSFGPAMAAAAALAIAEVDEIVEPGGIDPEQVHTPALYIDRVVARAPDDPLP
jgi:3-oxoadipate CoA-transferase alpha subunit